MKKYNYFSLVIMSILLTQRRNSQSIIMAHFMLSEVFPEKPKWFSTHNTQQKLLVSIFPNFPFASFTCTAAISLYLFSIAAVTNDHKPGGLNSTSLSCVRSVGDKCDPGWNLEELHFFLEALGRICLLLTWVIDRIDSFELQDQDPGSSFPSL